MFYSRMFRTENHSSNQILDIENCNFELKKFRLKIQIEIKRIWKNWHNWRYRKFSFRYKKVISIKIKTEFIKKKYHWTKEPFAWTVIKTIDT